LPKGGQIWAFFATEDKPKAAAAKLVAKSRHQAEARKQGYPSRRVACGYASGRVARWTPTPIAATARHNPVAATAITAITWSLPWPW
jgi:hypothetical protein